MEAVRAKYLLLQPLMTERMRRQWAACEAESLGRGGVSLVAEATGLSRTTIWAGRRELRRRVDHPEMDLTPERVRAPGGGRHLVEREDTTLLTALRDLVESSTRGDPQSPLFWTSKSTRKLAEELSARGHPVSYPTVAALLDDWGYSLQANRKTKEGEDDPDRDAQFEYINRQVRAFQRDGQPVISVDAKKKELIVGDFRNVPGGNGIARGHPGRGPRPRDFPDKKLGKAIPEGVYDLRRNEGWGERRRRPRHRRLRRGEHPGSWWQEMGSRAYPREGASAPDHRGCRRQQRLSVTALESGAVQAALASDLDLRISVCHFPPGTSKWNKIEHRMLVHPELPCAELTPTQVVVY